MYLKFKRLNYRYDSYESQNSDLIAMAYTILYTYFTTLILLFLYIQYKIKSSIK